MAARPVTRWNGSDQRRDQQSRAHQRRLPPGDEQRAERREEERPARPERPRPEVLDELGIVGFEREEDGREIGEERQRQQPDGQAERGEPRRRRTGRRSCRLRRYRSGPARGHRADADAEQHRGDQARAGEDPAPAALHRVVLVVVGAEGERRAAQHDADQHQRERNVQHDAEPREHRREAGEREHDRQDQPDVVGLPDRPDGVADHLALAVAPRPAGEQVPHAAAEVGAAEQHVGVEARRQSAGRQDLRRA